MLVSFKINNFLSFNKEQTFSMVPSLDVGKNDNLINLESVNLLKKAIILGANSSGKSNLLKALEVGKELIIGSPAIKYRNFFCKIKKENLNKETLFEYSFYINKVFYTYGFTMNLNKGKYLSEYLYNHDVETDQEKVIFERITTDNKLDEMFTYRFENIYPNRKKFDKYLKEFNNNSESLFLTKINLDNDLVNQFSELVNPFIYFKEKLNVNFQKYDFKYLDISLYEKQAEVNKLLVDFDTGISELIFEEIDLNYLETNFPEYFDEFIKYLELKKQQINLSFSVVLKQTMFTIIKDNQDIKIYKVLLKHFNAELAFEFFEESDGIRRLFDLFDILLVPKEESIYIFDELTRCIHPLLIIRFMEIFNLKLNDVPIQLVFTTHEANILKENIIRKDEVWFVEKEKDNSSKLYSLDIFKSSKKNILDAYLDGNYGAVPIFLKDEL